MFCYQLLLDFAGPASNVRVERVSRDCFTAGGALAEVMTLYENMFVDNPSDSMQNNDSTENRSQQLVIKVSTLSFSENRFNAASFGNSLNQSLVSFSMHFSLSQHLSCDY